jgi:hypothetical protein
LTLFLFPYTAKTEGALADNPLHALPTGRPARSPLAYKYYSQHQQQGRREGCFERKGGKNESRGLQGDFWKTEGKRRTVTSLSALSLHRLKPRHHHPSSAHHLPATRRATIKEKQEPAPLRRRRKQQQGTARHREQPTIFFPAAVTPPGTEHVLSTATSCHYLPSRQHHSWEQKEKRK